MQKTKLGISVGMLGAAIYFMGLMNSYLVAVLLAGYVLLCEDNPWLRRSAVKAITVMVVFSFLMTVVNFVPDVISVIKYIVSMFGNDFYMIFVSSLVNAIVTVLGIIENLVLLGLGVKALNQGTIIIPVVDNLLDKYM